MNEQINKIVMEWIGEDISKEFEREGNYYCGYGHEFAIGNNQALQDLRSRTPELVKKIIKELNK